MKLEGLKLWAEKDLLWENGNPEYGFLGFFVCIFADDRLSCVPYLQVPCGKDMQSAFSTLTRFLQQKDAGEILSGKTHMEIYCRDQVHDHIPYSFHRECWGFRVLTDRFAWYLACTPWNDKRHCTVYCYDRAVLMKALSGEKGLPERCYSVLPYTGERILIRFGEDQYELFPQYGGNTAVNLAFAKEQNEPLGISDAQVAAMVNGVIYGWDTPMANIQSYDEVGHYVPVMNERREKRGR